MLCACGRTDAGDPGQAFLSGDEEHVSVESPSGAAEVFDSVTGVTEELKARDPMRWVGMMNTLKAQIEEIIQEDIFA